MPSPIPVTRLLPKDIYPSLDIGICSSPLAKPSCGSTLQVPGQRFHRKTGTRLWSSVIHWEQLRSIESVGSGGFGSVYKADYFGKTVALKKVKKQTKNRLASRQSFWAELNAAHLRHTHVVRIIAATTCIPLECEDTNNIGMILMEYVGSRNLHQLIYECVEPLHEDRWLRYSVHIAHGLRFLHSHDIVHLDIKPVSHVGGTYTHRAPELLKGEAVSPTADIFSFGITMWQLITRKQPYTGDRQHVLYAVVAHNLRPCVQQPEFVSEQGQSSRSLLERCWSREASCRPTAQELVPSLEQLRSSL
eukprot:XP_011618801.1 PREDICTED: serine/threonine-protein kinase mos-like [Takifugu rubripes]